MKRHVLALTVLIWNKRPKDFSKEILDNCNTKVYLHITHCTVYIQSWAYVSKRPCLYFWFSLFLSKTKFFRLGQNLIIREQKLCFFLLVLKVLGQGSIFYSKVTFILNFGPKRNHASFAIILLVWFNTKIILKSGNLYWSA